MTDDKKNRKKTASRKNKKASSATSTTPISADPGGDPVARQVPIETNFEDAFDELEQIVEHLEDGEQSLQDSLAQFERGIALARFCQKNLAEAEQKVMVLTGDIESADTGSLEPFDRPGNSDSE